VARRADLDFSLRGRPAVCPEILQNFGLSEVKTASLYAVRDATEIPNTGIKNCNRPQGTLGDGILLLFGVFECVIMPAGVLALFSASCRRSTWLPEVVNQINDAAQN
jgi:hypothetical protein